MYIIIWRNSHRDPHVGMDSHDFIESFSDEESAREHAEETLKNENEDSPSPWYFDYKIYQEVD